LTQLTCNVPIDSDVSIPELAEFSRGFVAADLANWCNESAMTAIRENSVTVTRKHFIDSSLLVTPTAVRGEEIVRPVRDWKTLGGLESVQQLLERVLEWPLTRQKEMNEFGITLSRGKNSELQK
jgi:SpoVK/Ycf46/Vps4 family AAA+-type ATPase